MHCGLLGGHPASAGGVEKDKIESPSPMAREMAKWADQRGHKDLAAAIEYNSLHVDLLNPDTKVRQLAEKRLGEMGDDFTVHWLKGIDGGVKPNVPAEISKRLQREIRKRMASSGAVPENMARTWLLRGAVSDVTCNSIEGPLKTWSYGWVRKHASTPEVRRDLEAFAKTPVEAASNSGFGPLALERAVQTGRNILAASPLPGKP